MKYRIVTIDNLIVVSSDLSDYQAALNERAYYQQTRSERLYIEPYDEETGDITEPELEYN